MRKAGLISLLLAVFAGGAITVAAAGGDHGRPVDVSAANGRTVAAGSVHYAVAIRMTKERQPLTPHIKGAASPASVAAHLHLGDLKLKDGTRLPGTSGALLMSKPFLYESAPAGITVFGNIHWLRLQVS